MVAVDLLLSHWPKSREAAVPFLASPEVLCVDVTRLHYERFANTLFEGQREPVGAVNLESLKNRPSRRLKLDQLLGYYALSDAVEARQKLVSKLRVAAERLGPPLAESTLGDPAMMAVHALNKLDPTNWRKVLIEQPEGRQVAAIEYVPPVDERLHFESLQKAAQRGMEEASIKAQLSLALEDPSKSSPELAKAVCDWARKATSSPKDGDAEDYMGKAAVVSAAMIVIRDGDATLFAENNEWARQ